MRSLNINDLPDLRNSFDLYRLAYTNYHYKQDVKMQRAFLLSLLFLFSVNTFGQTAAWQFKYVTADDGLSSNRITSILRDSKEHLWVGTDMGLNRYDGHQVKQYLQNDRSKSSISNNTITSILEDRSHQVWIGTSDGLNLYNAAKDDFETFRNDPSQKNSISSNCIVSIYSDRKGRLWVLAGGNTLNLWIPDKKHFERYPMNLAINRSLFGAAAIGEDSNGNLWVSSYGRQLFCFNPSTKIIKTYDLKISSTEKTLNNLYVDQNDRIWIGTRGAGLLMFDINTVQTQHFPVKADGSGTNKSLIFNIIREDQTHLLFAVDQGGINRLNLETMRFEYVRHSSSNKTGLNTDGIWTLYKDHEGILWVGTANGGLNYYNPKDYKFGSYSSSNVPQMKSDVVGGFFEDRDGNLWIATEGGLNCLNQKTGKFTHFRYDSSNENSLSGNVVRCIAEDNDGYLWIGTWDAGLCRFDKKTGKFDRFSTGNSSAFSISGKNVWNIKKDSQGFLWLALTYVGVDVLNPKKGIINRFRSNPKQSGGLGADIIYSFVEDRQKNMWVCTINGLYRFDRNRNYLNSYRNFPDRDIRAFLQDSKGRLWAGSANKGIFLFDQYGKVIKRFDINNGLANNQVHAIIEDDLGKLWISTNLGLSRLDPATGHIRSFYVNDGLQGNQFFMQSAMKSRNGNLYFGGYNGFNIINPQNLKQYDFNSPVYFNDLQVSNQSVTVGAADSILKNQLSATREITLPWRNRTFSLYFNAINYTLPSKTQYAYKLEGFDNKWNNIGHKNGAHFTNLDPGEYTLHVIAANSDGIWNKQSTSIKIVILPPWYKTWWAYTAYALLMGIAYYLLIRYRTNQAALKFKIETANYKVEQEKELHRKKADFFTNVSHELRTPLTLIVNPLKDMLKLAEFDTKKEQLNIVYQNAKRLLSLVNQLLLFRKSEKELGMLTVSRFDLSEVCHEVFLCFSNLAKQQTIDFSFHKLGKQFELYADREKIEIILFNLLSNAFKYTPRGKSIALTIAESEQGFTLKIEDTGIGIPDGIGTKLFEQFYKVNQTGSTAGGFGIGLFVVKNFVDAHGGTIDYESELGVGTTFTLSLKNDKAPYLSSYTVADQANASNLLEELMLDGQHQPLQHVEPEIDAGKLYREVKVLLIVDDNAELRNYIKAIFADEYEVIEAENGLEGVELVKTKMPAIIICDVMMPGIDGIDFCRYLKEDSSLSHIPIILLTASSSSDTQLKGFESGADEYITKPFERDILRARVSGLLKNRSNLQNFFYNRITLQPDNTKISAEYKEFLDKCIDHIEKNLTNEHYSLKHLAADIGTSYSTLYQRIKLISGQTGVGFHRSIKLRKAAEFLVTTHYNINEVAFMVGMKDIRHFREHFNKLFGMNPSDYVKKYRRQFNEHQSIKRHV